MEDTNQKESTFNLEYLENEFNLKMKEYEQAYMNYISTLNNEKNDSVKKYVSIQGKTFWGSSGLWDGTIMNENDCIAKCSADKLCSGATFNPDKKYCWTRTGDGSIDTGLINDYALVTENTQNIFLIQQLNQQLSDLIEEINNELMNSLKTNNEDIDNKNKQKIKMQLVNDQLKIERANMNDLIEEKYSIEQDYKQNSIYVTQTNIQYILWGVFAFLIFILTIKNIFFPNLPSHGMNFLFWFVIFIAFMLTTFHLNTAPGFLLCGLVLLIIAFIQLKIIPQP